MSCIFAVELHCDYVGEYVTLGHNHLRIHTHIGFIVDLKVIGLVFQTENSIGYIVQASNENGATAAQYNNNNSNKSNNKSHTQYHSPFNSTRTNL